MGDATGPFTFLLPLIVLTCATRLIWVDFRRFEIETPTLILMGAALLTEAALLSSREELLIRTLSAVAFYAVLMLITRSVPGLSRVGAGDPPLIGVTVLMISPWLVTWALLSATLILITAAAYSVARGKRLLRSMFPAAPPVLGAGVLIYLALRLPI